MKKQSTKWFYFKSLPKTFLFFVAISIAQLNFAQDIDSTFTKEILKGETLYKYSVLYNVAVDSLKKWNNLQSDIIKENGVISIVNYNKINSAQLEINKLKYKNEIFKKAIEVNENNYEKSLELIEVKKNNIDKEDPFAMHAFLEISKEKSFLKDSFELKRSELLREQKNLIQLINEKEKQLTKSNSKKVREDVSVEKSINIGTEKKNNETVVKVNVDKKTDNSFIEKENNKRKKEQVAINKEQKAAYNNIEEGISEVLVFDTEIENEVDTSSNKYKRKQAILLKKLELELDTNKVDQNIMVSEVAVVRNKKNQKYKIGDRVDYVRKDKSKFFLSRAMLEIDKYNFKKANEFINKSIDLNPSYTEAYILKGDMFASMKYFDKAIDAYENALFLDDRIAQVFYNVGNCYIHLNKKGKAIENMGKAVSVDSTYVLAYLGRSSLYIDDKNYRDALKDYNKILKINKFFYPALKGRGIALMNLGEYDKSIIDFNQFLEYDKSDVSLFYHRGMAKMYNSDIYGACLDFLTASESGYLEADKAIKKYCE